MSKWISGRRGKTELFQASTNSEAKALSAHHLKDGPVTIWKRKVDQGWVNEFTLFGRIENVEFPIPAGVKNRGFAKMKALDPERLREVSAKAGRNSWAAKKAD